MAKELHQVDENIFEIPYLRKDFNVTAFSPGMFPSSEQLIDVFNERVSEERLSVTKAQFTRARKGLESTKRLRWNHRMLLAGYDTATHNEALPSSTFGGYRYVNQIAFFMDYLGLGLDLAGKTALDIGPWSGSSTVVYEAFGAAVDAVEEGPLQLEIIAFLKKSFGLDYNIIKDTAYNIRESDKYDLISNFGVLYHVTDPLIFLRICYNALKPNGTLLLETMSTNDCQDDSFIRYEGSFTDGANWFVPNRIALLRLLQDAGFVDIKIASISDDAKYGRTFAMAQKRKADDPWQPSKLGWSVNID